MRVIAQRSSYALVWATGTLAQSFNTIVEGLDVRLWAPPTPVPVTARTGEDAAPASG